MAPYLFFLGVGTWDTYRRTVNILTSRHFLVKSSQIFVTAVSPSVELSLRVRFAPAISRTHLFPALLFCSAFQVEYVDGDTTRVELLAFPGVVKANVSLAQSSEQRDVAHSPIVFALQTCAQCFFSFLLNARHPSF